MQKLFALLLAFILFGNIQAQTLRLNQSPENYQLYARDSENKAVVPINGKIVEGDINVKISEGDEKWKRIEFKCFRDGELIESKEMALNYVWSHAGFSFNQKIESGLVQYKFQLTLINGSKSEICFTADSIVCGDADIITGQSNSHASSSLSPSDNPFCRSFGVKTGYKALSFDFKTMKKISELYYK